MSLVEVMRNKSGLPRQFFLEEFCMHMSACLSTLKPPNCGKKTILGVSAASVSPAKIHWVIFLSSEGFESTFEMKSCPLPLFATLQPEIFPPIESFKK